MTTKDYNQLKYTIYKTHAVVIDCDSSLQSVDIPASIDGVPVSMIGANAFRDCVRLEYVTLSEGIECIENKAFFRCVRLKKITISESVKEVAANAFDDCVALKDVIYVGNKEQWNQISIGEGSQALEKATVHFSNNTTAEDENGRLKYQAPLKFSVLKNYAVFIDCDSSTQSVNIPSSVDGVPETTIGDNAFRDCVRLESVYLPSSVIHIGNKAFFRCTNLWDLTVPEGVTHIGANAFDGCSDLRSINLPSSLESIGERAFINLQDVYYAGAEEQWDAISIGINNGSILRATIHFASQN